MTKDIFRVTAKPLASLVAGQHYEGWRCEKCRQSILVFEATAEVASAIAQIQPADGKVKVVCMHCAHEGLYGLNDRVRLTL